MRRCALALLSCLLMLADLSVLPSSATADTATPLRLSGFGDLVQDRAAGRLYISDGKSAVVVVDEVGTELARVGDLPGAGDLALSDDGSVLWVAAPENDAIVSVDTATLATRVYDVGADGCPAELALTAGRVWFTEACSFERHALGSLDPVDGTVVDVPIPDLDVRFRQVNVLATSPAIPGAIFVGSRAGSYEGELFRYSVAGGEEPSATLVEHRSVDVLGEDLEISADGETLATPSDDYRTDDLGRIRSYRDGIDNVATSATGARASSSGGGGTWVYLPNSRDVLRHYRFDVPVAGLAWAGDLLLAVTQADGGYVLRVISPRGRPEVEIRSQSQIYKDYGDPILVRARVRYAPKQAPVQLFEETRDGARRLLDSDTLNRHGIVTLISVATRTARLVVVVPGNELYDAVEASTIVTSGVGMDVSMRHYRARDGDAYLYDVSQRALMVIKVRPNHAGDCVTVVLSYKQSSNWLELDTLQCLRLSAASTVRVVVPGDPRLANVPLLLSSRVPATKTSRETIGPGAHFRFRR